MTLCRQLIELEPAVRKALPEQLPPSIEYLKGMVDFYRLMPQTDAIKRELNTHYTKLMVAYHVHQENLLAQEETTQLIRREVGMSGGSRPAIDCERYTGGMVWVF